MGMKITIIGTGAVGSTIDYSLTIKNIASEIVLIDINKEKAEGEALDISQGTPFCGPINVHAGNYEDAVCSDIVVYACGIARKAGQTRLDLAQTNVDVAKKVIPEITKNAPDALYIIVANPVDILTYQFYKYSNLKPNQIIGSGTILDTARLRTTIADYYEISENNVHAYIFGEHGDSSFVPWSLCNISGIPVDKYADCLTSDLRDLPPDADDVITFVKKSGGKIIEQKGATFYAVSIAVVHICELLCNDADNIVTVSSMLDGEYGINDVCLSTLAIIGKNGIKDRVEAPLTEEEIHLLKKSAETLKGVISQLKFD